MIPCGKYDKETATKSIYIQLFVVSVFKTLVFFIWQKMGEW